MVKHFEFNSTTPQKHCVRIEIIGDNLDENLETIFVKLDGSEMDEAMITIIDDGNNLV